MWYICQHGLSYFLVLTGYSLVTYHVLLSISDFPLDFNQFYWSKINSLSFRAALNSGSDKQESACTDASLHMSQREKLIKGEGTGKSMTCAKGVLWKGSGIYWRCDEDKEKWNATIHISFLKGCWKEFTDSTGQNSQSNEICLFSLKEESITCLGNCS